MKDNYAQTLADAAITIASRAAAEYIRVHKLSAAPEALFECLKANIKLRLPEALRDAKEAFACNMHQAGVATFSASIALAGIDAAKEAGFPIPAVTENLNQLLTA